MAHFGSQALVDTKGETLLFLLFNYKVNSLTSIHINSPQFTMIYFSFFQSSTSPAQAAVLSTPGGPRPEALRVSRGLPTLALGPSFAKFPLGR